MKEALEAQLEIALARILEDLGGDATAPRVVLDRPRQKTHGDYACNVAMPLAKDLGRPPREIAALLIEALGNAGGLLDRVEIAGPGFINFWLAEARWHDVLLAIVKAGSDYGRSQTGRGKKVQVEFVSANPTGPLSTGHGRQAVLGDCIARLLDFSGFEVTREYYFNNAGRQMRVLGQSRPRHVAGPELAEVRVRAGDRLLIAAGADAAQSLQSNVLLGTVTETPARAFRRTRAPIAIQALTVPNDATQRQSATSGVQLGKTGIVSENA